MKRIIFCIIWFIVIYFALCVLIGGVAGGIAGANDPVNASEAGAIAGATLVARYRAYIFGVAIVASAADTLAGFLPGTGVHKKENNRHSY